MSDPLSALLGGGGIAALVTALAVAWRTRRVTNASIEQRAQSAFEGMAHEYRSRLDAAMGELAEVRRELSQVRSEADLLGARVEGLLRKLGEVTDERDRYRRERAELLEAVGAGVLSAHQQRAAPTSEETGRHQLPSITEKEED